MSSTASGTSRLRRLVALLATLLMVPLAAVLGAVAPAHAVAFELTGTVLDAAGEGLVGVRVTAYVAPDETTVRAFADTDANGDYKLTGLSAGEYRLKFTRSGYRDAWYGDEDEHETIVIDSAGTASTDDGPLEDNTLPDQALTSSATHQVTGVVTRAGGVPLEGIAVTAYLDGDDDQPGVTTTTAPGTGGYTLALETGIYQIRYSSPDYAGAWYGADNAASDTAADVVVHTDGRVTVGGVSTGCGADSASTLCPVTLAPVSAGQTYPVAGEVVDANDDPVVGIDVQIRAGASIVAAATTQADGSYRAVVAPGDYTVTFSGPDWVTAWYTATGSTATATVRVAANGDLSTVPAETLSHNRLRTMTLASTATSYSGSVVSSAAGHPPISAVQVRAFPEDDDAPQVVTTTDNSGHYELGLPVGQYEIQFTDPAGNFVQGWLGGATHAVAKVAQGPTAERILTINGDVVTSLGVTQLSPPEDNQTFALTGRVEDAIGEGIGGVTVTATAQGQGVTTTAVTAGDGSYTLLVRAGSYKVAAHKSGGDFLDGKLLTDDDPPADSIVAVSATGVITVDGAPSTGALEDIVLTGVQKFGLNGTVTNSSSQGLQGVKIDVFEDGDETTASLTPSLSSGSGGSWATGSVLGIGTYSVRFKGSTIGGTTYSTTYLPGGNVAKDVAIGQGGKIYVDGVLRTNPLSPVVMAAVTADTTYAVTGDVNDMVDEPLSHIQVAATVVSGGQATNAVTDASGTYQLNLKPGSYQLLFSGSKAGGAADDFASTTLKNDDEATAVVAVTPTGEVSVVGNEDPIGSDRKLPDVNLAGAARWNLSGTVVGAGGAGLPQVRVEARSPDASVSDPAIGTAVTNGSGAFEITSLPVGHYNLRLVDNDLSDGRTFIATWLGGDTKKVVSVGTGGTLKIDGVGQGSRTVGAIPMEEATANRSYPLMGGIYDAHLEQLDGADAWVLPVGVTDTRKAVAHTVSGAASALATSKDLGPNGVYELSVRAGRYWLRYAKAGYQPQFLQNDDSSGPATITVTADGRVTSPNLELDSEDVLPDVSLLLTPTAFSAQPKLTGKLAVGQTVTATFGALKGRKFSADAVTVEWFLNGKPADDLASGSVGQKLKLTTAAATKKLAFRVTIDPTADDEDYPNAPSVFTSKAVTVPKAVAKLKGVYKKKKLTVVLSVPTLTRPTGKLVVTEGKKKIATITVKSKNKGKVVVKLKKLKKGKHKLTLTYSGTKTVLGAKTVVKIKK